MSHFDLAARRHKIEELNAQTLQEDFWSDSHYAQQVLRKCNALKTVVDAYDQLEKLLALKHTLNDQCDMVIMQYRTGGASDILLSAGTTDSPGCASALAGGCA